MNFTKLMIAVAAFALVIAVWKMTTRVDRSDSVAVATAFTKAIKGKDTGTASAYSVPEKARAWRERTGEELATVKSGAEQRFFEGIPFSSQFTAPITVAGKTVIMSEDKAFSLELTQVNDKWDVANF